MHHRLPIILVLVCLVGIFLACFAPVLFRDQQFGFRDSAHYYYPLYLRVQQEWDAGRWPLWELEENAGMPLLGNPTAAVLYPLKVVYAALPYAWGARVYVMAHTVLAFATMLVLMRSWGTSWTGSGLSALAYAFGAPILFQGCNIIYLVGAAWLPLGVHAADRWVRLGRRWGILELAIVLAMQLLGGDPQAGYLLGLSAIAYAGGLAWHRAAERRRAEALAAGAEARRSPGWLAVVLIALAVGAWIAATLAVAAWAPQFRSNEAPPRPLPWMWCVRPAVTTTWAVAGLSFLIYWAAVYRRGQGRGMPIGRAWVGLAAAAGLAASASAIQLLPVMEYTQLTGRAADAGIHDIYPFSVAPIHLVGMFWPDFLGITFIGNTYWGNLAQPPGMSSRLWVPSLYLGCLTMALAAGAFAVRRGTAWRVWLSMIVAISLVGSLGQFTSPILITRVLAETTKWEPIVSLSQALGPLDPPETTALRQDHFLRDGDGSIYWGMATVLPLFGQFRFPAKLFTFTCLGLAALAGLGWDGLRRGGGRRATAMTAALLVSTAMALVIVLIGRAPILAALRTSHQPSLFGPTDIEGGYRAIVRSLAQASIVLAVGLAAIRLASRRPALAGTLVLLAMTVDLAAANARYVFTVPQSLFETRPEVLEVIEAAERDRPSPGPYRIHRMPIWSPPIWITERSPERNREMADWERNTLQPKYGISLGVEYAHVLGVAELYDYDWYFGGFWRTVRDPDLARNLGIAAGQDIVYFPRRTFDMWNARYFVVPLWGKGWNDQNRGYASLLLEAETIYPRKSTFQGPGGAEKEKEWGERHDVQVLRNRRPHPRAWVTHKMRTLPPVRGLEADKGRQKAMQEIVYMKDHIWNDPDRQVFDYLEHAWVDGGPAEGGIASVLGRYLGWTERDDPAALSPYLRGGASLESEAVKLTYPDPQHVELDVTLKSPGVVVLADVYYPGWELTIDGVPAPIYRINRLMRGAAVGKDHHRLVYTYNPRSFRNGKIVSAAGLVAIILLAATCCLRPVDPVVGAPSEPSPAENPTDE